MYYEVKVKCLRQLDNGLIKGVTENYLVDALSITESEANVLSEVGASNRQIESLSSKQSAIKEVVPNDGSEQFWKVKIIYTVTDENSEKEKKVAAYLLVPADDVDEVLGLVAVHLREMLVPWYVSSVSESNIVDVIRRPSTLDS